MSVSRRRRPARDERGAVAILVALTITSLLVVAGLVLDFGLIRLDKQSVKSATDSAATAGIAAGDKGTGEIHTFHAVCGALSYLKATNRLESLPDSICSSANLASNTTVACDPASAGTHATYDQTITSAGATYRVVIKSPYVLTSDGWSEESVPNLANDQSTVGGCDQVGVQVFETRTPMLGSLAGAGDLRFGVRSVARAFLPSDDSLSPALLLLERTGCSALTVGSAGGGAGSYIAVKGVDATPGSIHVDSDATGPGCGPGSGQQIMQGKQSDGIVAYGSTNPSGVAGVITSYATYLGVPSGTISDGLSNVNATTAASSPSAVKLPILGRERVTRSVADLRYRQPVRTAIAAASAVWGNSTGWTMLGCNPTPAQLLAATTRLWIDCPNNSGITISGTIQATDVYFNGFIKGGMLAMPNAQRVYVSNTTASGDPINSSAVNLSNGTGFCIRATTCSATPTCSASVTSGRARLFIRRGDLSATGGMLRMCNTTSFLLGGDTVTGCVPASDGAAPTATPCPTSPTQGNTFIGVSGSAGVDWTAPNEYPGVISAALRTAAWSNFEDLAVWSESAGDYKFGGGGGLRTVGVFMVPNASVQVGGGSSQTLTNAQFITRTFGVSGGGTLSLVTDPKNAVTIPPVLSPVLIR